jgi:ABC-type transport system involved in multi-copper enzyme maturation permease subunit
VLIGVARSLPALFYSWGWLRQMPGSYLVPWGLVFMGLGLLYVLTSLFLWSDNRTIIMTRRELSAFFFSPIAYLVLLGLTTVAWFLFNTFVSRVSDPRLGVTMEPIVQYYIIDWWPIICVIFVVPVLTMRLMSEEWRSGTLEVTLTAPVDESSVVLSKFFAGLIMFLLLWVPWGLFLVALRIMGGQEFDYRPLLSFFIALTCTGAGFIAMGLFFSSLTRNQIVSAVLTFAAMIFLFFLFFIKRRIEGDLRQGQQGENVWYTVLSHISYVDLWIDAIRGFLIPRHLLFHLSAAVLWLYLTIKVLEARKWT